MLGSLRKRFHIGMAAILITGVTACDQMAIVAMNQLETTEFSVQGDKLLMAGIINSRTLDQFNAVYAAHPNVKTLVELDVPGSVDDDTMIALAYRVRSLGLNTHLTSKSEVHSGGVDLFLAGVHRTMEPGAKLGVHSWSDGKHEAIDYPRSAPEHELNRKYIEDMLGDDAFYWFTIHAASADDIHIMTPAEIRKYRLLKR